MTMSKRYGQWAGNPKGHAQDPERCVAAIYGRREFVEHQCYRKHGHGPGGSYCSQHAKRHTA